MALFETMKYTLIKKDRKIEIRKYDDILLASTKSEMSSTQDSGFSNVFRYISGNNTMNSKISMTTPVVTYQENDQLVTGFYVPSKYTKETIPQPSEEAVFINELKNSFYAVIRFRGNWKPKNFDKHDQLLLSYLRLNGFSPASQRLILRYQPPFVPGIFRHNEIAYQINYQIKNR